MADSDHYFSLFKRASAIVIDVDGVLTDGSLFVTNEGDPARVMNIRDGYAMQLAVKKGLKVAVISGGRSAGVEARLKRLGIPNVATDVSNKITAFEKIVMEIGLDLSTTIYIGDDMPDVEVMKRCGIPCCPFDAIPEILSFTKYISPVKGGKGCVRDIIEKVLKLQQKWE